MGVQLNEDKLFVVKLTLSPVGIVLNTSAEQTFTLTGLVSGDVIKSVSKPTAQAGLAIYGFRNAGANLLGITFGNFTGSTITPTASEVYTVVVMRPEKTYTTIPS